MSGVIKMISITNIKTDQDWSDMGFEYVGYLEGRKYIVANHIMEMALVLVDEGNGHCHFEDYYSYAKISEVFQKTAALRKHRGEPIYKVITLSIKPGERIIHEMFGWYHHGQDAINAVNFNSCDMQDHAFNYVLISCSYEGAYGLDDEELRWYTWDYDKKQWLECERPEACSIYHFT